MKKLVLFFFVLGLLSFYPQEMVYSQTRTTVTKNCGSCGKSVSADSRVGMRCPHCRVIWGKENSHTTTRYENTYIPRIGDLSMPQSISGFKMTRVNANLRSNPSTKASVITVLSSYTSVEVISRDGDWYYVKCSFLDNNHRFQNTRGYLHKSTVR